MGNKKRYWGKKIKTNGIKRLQIGLEIKCERLSGPNTKFWALRVNNKIIGKVTSAVYSPRLKKNIALAMVDINYSKIGLEIEVSIDKKNFKCEIIEKPFFDPKKQITSKSLKLWWCPRTDSNRGPIDYKSIALPAELQAVSYTHLTLPTTPYV